MMNLDALLETTNPMLLLSGLTFIIAGGIMYFFPPKKVNSLYGYRTARSMKNQKNWDFAQIYGAKALCVLGLVFILISFTRTLLPFDNDQHALFGMFLLIIGVVIMFLISEKAIKKNEEKNKGTQSLH